MLQAPVGFQCPDCVAEAQAQVRPAMARAQRASVLRSIKTAPATLTLIALNVAVWLGITLTGGDSSRLVDQLALHANATCGIGDATYIRVTAAACAASGGVYFPGVSQGAWWQILTSAFTHISPMHIGFNMLALWFLGPQLERVLGLGRFVALYALSALAGSAAVYWLADPDSTTVGASGAVFGLMGALLVIAWRRGGDLQNLLMWLGINIAFTFFGGAGISWQGHLGGLAGGLAIAGIYMLDRGRASARTWLLLGLVGLALVAVIAVRVLGLA